jgi:large conductance mechanosensitive channel
VPIRQEELMLEEFKKFIFKGDVVALSTGVIIGAAFGKIVEGFTKGIVEPILRLFGSGPSVSLGFKIKDGVYIDLGVIITALISFLITAAVVFFFIVKPAQAMMARLKKEEAAAPPPPPPAEVVLLTEIRDQLRQR